MIKLITHTDLDGIGCYIVANHFIGENNIDVSYCDYADVNEVAKEVINNIHDYNKVYITDISVNNEVAELLDIHKDKVVLLDHHRSALHLNEYTWATVKEEVDTFKTCGTELLFIHLLEYYDLSYSLGKFVELVRQYDTWEWKSTGNIVPKQLNDLLSILGRDAFIEDINRKMHKFSIYVTSEDKKLLSIKQGEITRYIEKKKIIPYDILGYKAGIVFGDQYISELGNTLAVNNPQFDLIVIISQNTISYRTTKDNVDVSEIAKHFGGGGHHKASGSPIEQNILDGYISSLFNVSYRYIL